jgi:hypothetical protein
MELPAGPVQDYIHLAGICAIYVACSPSGACEVGVTRDLKRTQATLRRQGREPTYIAAFWINDRKLATKIVNEVNKTGCGASLDDAAARIAATAEKMKVHLTAHAAVLQRVETAVSHVTAALEQARKDGGLQWFNRAFHDFRLRAKQSGHKPMTYLQAQARLRQVILRRALAGEGAEFGAAILPQVFPPMPG